MLSHEHHHHLSKVLHLKDKLGKIYLHLVIQGFAISLISVFVPIYLLSLDFSLTEVIIFLLIEWTIFGIFAPIYSKFISKIGLKEAILVRTPFLILAFVLLFLLESNATIRAIYWIIPIIGGISGSIYALSITSLFAEGIGKKHQNEKTAKMISYPQMIAIVGPIIGGFLSSVFSFHFVIGIVTILLAISTIPIIGIKERVDHPKVNIKILQTIKNEFKDFILLCSYGVKGMVFYFLVPLIIYLYSTDIFVVGAVVSVIALCRSLYVIFLGKYCDKHDPKTIIRIGAIVTSMLLVFLAFFYESPYVYIIAIVAGFTNVMTTIVYETHLYKKARQHETPLNFLTFKEFSLVWGRILIFVTLLIFLETFEASFLVGAAGNLIFFFY